jgi:membrane-associated phospholipid phosphatase
MENEGIGGAVIAIIWALWSWFRRRAAQPTKSQYEK